MLSSTAPAPACTGTLRGVSTNDDQFRAAVGRRRSDRTANLS